MVAATIGMMEGMKKIVLATPLPLNLLFNKEARSIAINRLIGVDTKAIKRVFFRLLNTSGSLKIYLKFSRPIHSGGFTGLKDVKL